MRGGSAEVADIEGPVDGVTELGEEDRMRHRGLVELLREMVRLHAERLKLAARGLAARAARRYTPIPARLAVDRYGHTLVGLVDRDENVGVRWASRHAGNRQNAGQN